MSSYTNDFIYKYTRDIIIYISKLHDIKIEENEIDLCNKVKDKIYGYYNMSITEIKQEGIKWVNEMMKKEKTNTKPGSISYLLYGENESNQSINIKMGRFGEFLSKILVKSKKELELLFCGVQTISNTNEEQNKKKKKDIDVIYKDDKNKKIVYRELKGNIELDTEKLPATIAKCKEIEKYLQEKYPEYKIDCGILNWSVYDRKSLTAGLSHIKTFEEGGIKINHMGDFLKMIEIEWSEDDYYGYFRELGTIINNLRTNNS